MVNNYEINKDIEFPATDILTVENNHLHKWPENTSYQDPNDIFSH